MEAEKLKIMKEKAENSRGRGKYELTQADKSYSPALCTARSEERRVEHGTFQ